MKKQMIKATTLAIAVAAAVVMATPSTAEAGGPGGPSISVSRAGGNFGGRGIGGRGVGFGGFGGGGFGGGGLGIGGGFYTGGLFQGYASGRIPVPPYFAIHPPVYYSAPVPRTYGYSPFAYPGHVRTPDLPAEAFGQPTVINNPYCSTCDKHETPAVAESDDLAVAGPKLFVNPFVNQQKAPTTRVHLAVEKK